MFLVNAETRQKLEQLEKQKEETQNALREISSKICCIRPNYFGLWVFPNPILEQYECQQMTLYYRLYDIQAEIDSLKTNG